MRTFDVKEEEEQPMLGGLEGAALGRRSKVLRLDGGGWVGVATGRLRLPLLEVPEVPRGCLNHPQQRFFKYSDRLHEEPPPPPPPSIIWRLCSRGGGGGGGGGGGCCWWLEAALLRKSFCPRSLTADPNTRLQAEVLFGHLRWTERADDSAMAPLPRPRSSLTALFLVTGMSWSEPRPDQ